MGNDTTFIDLKIASTGNLRVGPTVDHYTEKRRQAAEDGRLAVQPFILEALMQIVHLMRTSKDEQMQFKCATKILDRGWGLPKALPPDDPGAVGNGNSIIDLLAAASQHVGRLEREGYVNGVLPPPPVSEVLPQTLETIVPETREDAEFLEFLNGTEKDA